MNQLRSCRRSSLSGREPAYARLMENPNPLVRVQAANSWGVWEDAVVSLEPNAKPNVYSDRPPAALLALVRTARLLRLRGVAGGKTPCCATPYARPASRAC